MKKTKNRIFVGIGAFLVLAVALIFCEITKNTKAFAQENEPCQHEYEETVVESTCSEKGYTLYTCKLCGDNYKDTTQKIYAHFENTKHLDTAQKIAKQLAQKLSN